MAAHTLRNQPRDFHVQSGYIQIMTTAKYVDRFGIAHALTVRRSYRRQSMVTPTANAIQVLIAWGLGVATGWIAFRAIIGG